MHLDTLDHARRQSLDPSSGLQTSGFRSRAGSATSEDFAVRSLQAHERTLHLEKKPTSSGFLFSTDLPPTSEITPDDSAPDLTGGDAARGQRFANIFLNSAKNINAKYNIVDRPETQASSDPSKASQKKVKVSRASRNRAELVKATFEIKYHCLNLALDITLTEPTQHEGIEGVYNPLQVIRNREIKNRLEHHSPSVYRTLPLACNAFSSHSRDGKSWSMVWGIELKDFVADFGWRQLHWNKLRNAKGELWFPNEGSSKDKHKTLHDKLWDDKDTDSIIHSEDIILKVPIMSARDKPKTSRRLKRNIKEKAKRIYGSASTGSSILEPESTDNGSNIFNKLSSLESISRIKIDRVGRRLSIDTLNNFLGTRRGSSDAYNTFSSEGEPSSESERKKSIPKIVVTDPLLSPDLSNKVPREKPHVSPTLQSTEIAKSLSGKELGSVNDISFSQVNLQKSPMKDALVSVESVELSEDSEDVDFAVEPLEGPDPKNIDQEDSFALLGRKVKFLEALLFLSSNYIGSLYPLVIEAADEKVKTLHNDMIKNLLLTAIRINDEHLPAQENLYSGFLEETNTLIHLANDKHAVRIDNLLSATDRSYNELNTSLLMDLRKVSEQLEKYNSRFFGPSVTAVLRDAQGNALSNVQQYQTLYLVLENVIVVLLRLIWIFANIFKIVWLFFRSIYLLLAHLWNFLT